MAEAFISDGKYLALCLGASGRWSIRPAFERIWYNGRFVAGKCYSITAKSLTIKNTSNRHHLLLIAGFAFHRERDALFSEHLNGVLWDEMAAIFEDMTREPPKKKSERLFLDGAIPKLNHDHNCYK